MEHKGRVPKKLLRGGFRQDYRMHKILRSKNDPSGLGWFRCAERLSNGSSEIKTGFYSPFFIRHPLVALHIPLVEISVDQWFKPAVVLRSLRSLAAIKCFLCDLRVFVVKKITHATPHST
jgi:hypothetical protein